MRTLYLDCSMGAAGDMLAAALLELLPDPGSMLERLNGLGIPDVIFSLEKSEKCGITGSHFTVTVKGAAEGDEPHSLHSGLTDIEDLVMGLPLPLCVRTDIISVYHLIAQAESHVHGVPVRQIHFHEVGTMDAVADVTAVCLLMHEIGAQQVYASPVRTGCGQVRCAHGILPVPAPATAHILRGIPIYAGDIQSELCTPTGAALLKYFVKEFIPMPVLVPLSIGYGMGKKDFPLANCLRAILAEQAEKPQSVTLLSCNLDDMCAEDIAFAMEILQDAGALDVWTQPIGMKKSRPGTILNVLCPEGETGAFARLMLLHTTTLGVRYTACQRITLDRRTETADTPLGPMQRKISTGLGITRSKYEYEDIAQAARANGLSVLQVRALLKE